jgi:uncharacterized protein with PQ loop repeat
MSGLSNFSAVIGWIYCLLFLSSFLTQNYVTWRLKSAEGYSIDYQWLNLHSFLFYTIYSIYGYYLHDPEASHVDLQDLVFAVASLIIAILTLFQSYYYGLVKNTVFLLVK